MKTIFKERPIQMCGPMVVGILEGRKTQTRRIIKPQPVLVSKNLAGDAIKPFWAWRKKGIIDYAHFTYSWNHPDANIMLSAITYGRPGDRLWVREPARIIEIEGSPKGHGLATSVFDDKPRHVRLRYEADGKESGWLPYPARLEAREWGQCIANGCYREASRISLEIVKVRVERLQDISANDCKAEGAEEPVMSGCHGKPTQEDLKKISAIGWRWSFQHLWESLNGLGSWERNDLLWVIEFRRVKP